MRRAAPVWLAVVLLPAIALADRVVLKDGRVFEGRASEADGKVLVELNLGTISFPAGEVESIERGPTSGDMLEWQLSQIDRTDPAALFQVAEWARQRDLATQSDDLLREVISLKPEHAQARKLLGFVPADGKWLKVPAALELAESKVNAGKCEGLLNDLLPAIIDLAGSAAERRQARELQARARLRARQFDLAQQAYQQLADTTSVPDSVRYAAAAAVLAEHPDGMYVVTEPYPPTAGLLGGGAEAIKPGPASLADEKVLAAALRERAKSAIKRGRSLMDEGRTLEAGEPDSAKARYATAGKYFDEADAVVPNIARSYRIEIARRRIGIVANEMNVEARKFDELKARIGEGTPAEYKDLLTRMLRALGQVRGSLETTLQLTNPFQQELVIEYEDAKLQLQRVNALRDLLSEELRGLR